MNVLLLYPELPDTFWSFKHSLEFINKAASPPLGILTVAAMLPVQLSKKLVDRMSPASPMKTLPGLIISSAEMKHGVAYSHCFLTFHEVRYGNKQSGR